MLLSLNNIEVVYDSVFLAVKGVDYWLGRFEFLLALW